MRVSRLLGFAFSLVGAGGGGSLAALYIGLRARKLVREAGGEIAGVRTAWRRIIVGACGAATPLPYTARLVIKAL